jgi:hypothetical protein
MDLRNPHSLVGGQVDVRSKFSWFDRQSEEFGEIFMKPVNEVKWGGIRAVYEWIVTVYYAISRVGIIQLCDVWIVFP